MKNVNLKLLILPVVFVIFFASCKKDEDATKKNEIVYDGADYELSKGYIEYYGQENLSPASYNFDILLTSSTVDYNGGSVSGTGSGLWVELYSSSPSEIVSGTYSFDASSGNALTFDWGAILLDLDWGSLKKSTDTRIASGTIKVVKSGSEYEFTFTCKDSANKDFTAFYKGTLEFHDYSEAK